MRNAKSARVDITDMIDYGFKELNANPAWRLLLEAYHEEAEARARDAGEFDGWTPRINELPDLDEPDLCRVHGKLISLGYLKFHLGGRLEGIKYLLSSDALQALNHHSRAADFEPDLDEPDDTLSAA